MTSAANSNPNWTNANSGPWHNGRPGYDGWGNRYWGMMPPWLNPYTAKPLLIVAMVLGFVFWWPIGLVLLGVMLWNRQLMRCGHRYYYGGGQQGGGNPPWSGWKSWSGGGFGGKPSSSGNRAFDEYRAETLRRLEEEQKEFGEFLDRLRFAKDKAEFDQFMNERRNKPAAPPEQPPQAPQA